MLIGYASIDVMDKDHELYNQIEALKDYAKKEREEIKIISEISNILGGKAGIYEPSYKSELSNLITNSKEGDSIVFATLDSIFSTPEGVAGTLSQLYSKNVKVKVLDFHVLDSIKPNKIMLQTLPRGMVYFNILEPLVSYRMNLKLSGII